MIPIHYDPINLFYHPYKQLKHLLSIIHHKIIKVQNKSSYCDKTILYCIGLT